MGGTSSRLGDRAGGATARGLEPARGEAAVRGILLLLLSLLRRLSAWVDAARGSGGRPNQV